MEKLKEHRITLPELGLIAGTRVMLGVGIGLLLSARLDDGERKVLGRALAAIGALTTVPLAIGLFRRG
jgi:hypothetical protein